MPFPYADQQQTVVRPAVIVSAPRLHEKTRLYFVAMITNAEHAAWEGDVEISNARGAGLPIPSKVRPAKITTIDERGILRSVGSLPKADREKVTKALQAFLAS